MDLGDEHGIRRYLPPPSWCGEETSLAPNADPSAYKKALGLLPIERLSARSRQPKVFERAVIRKCYQ